MKATLITILCAVLLQAKISSGSAIRQPQQQQPRLNLQCKPQLDKILDEYNLDITRVGNSTNQRQILIDNIDNQEQESYDNDNNNNYRQTGDWISLWRIWNNNNNNNDNQYHPGRKQSVIDSCAISAFTGFSIVLNQFNARISSTPTTTTGLFVEDIEEPTAFKSSLVDAMKSHDWLYSRYCSGDNNPLTSVCSQVNMRHQYHHESEEEDRIWRLLDPAIKLLPHLPDPSIISDIEIGFIYSSKMAHFILHINNQDQNQIAVYGSTKSTSAINTISQCLIPSPNYSLLSSSVKRLVTHAKFSSQKTAKLQLESKPLPPKNRGEARYGHTLVNHLLSVFIQFT